MLKKIKLENFRNHKNLEIELKKTTVLVGKNGVGKSNVLEAVALLSYCRSFRDDDKKNLVLLGADYARITGDSAEIFLQRNPHFLFQAREKGVVRKQTDFIGRLRSVVFSPETMEIITGSPRNRRKFLDIMISQSDRQYLGALVRYEKVRLERNSLLQRIRQNLATVSELEFWDDELVKEGTVVTIARAKAVRYLNQKLSQLYSKISGRTDLLDLDYIQSAGGDNFLERLKSNRQREIASGHTLIGPHRDDLVFLLNQCNMANFASRGEIRSAILALKIAELEFLAEINTSSTSSKGTQSEPLLLLDDIFSEFDPERRQLLCNLIESYQTIITTTEKEYLSKSLIKNAKIIEIS